MSTDPGFLRPQGKQTGPYPEVQLREFIANGRSARRRWCGRGMAAWQKAEEIPACSRAARVRAVPQAGVPMGKCRRLHRAALDRAGTMGLLGRSLLYMIDCSADPGAVDVDRILSLAASASACRPPEFSFAGQAGDIWYVFVLLGFCPMPDLAASTISNIS